MGGGICLDTETYAPDSRPEGLRSEKALGVRERNDGEEAAGPRVGPPETMTQPPPSRLHVNHEYQPTKTDEDTKRLPSCMVSGTRAGIANETCLRFCGGSSLFALFPGVCGGIPVRTRIAARLARGGLKPEQGLGSEETPTKHTARKWWQKRQRRSYSAEKRSRY